VERAQRHSEQAAEMLRESRERRSQALTSAAAAHEMLARHLELHTAHDGDQRLADLGLAVESIGASGQLGDVAAFERLMRLGQALGAPAITTGSGGRSGDEASFRQVVATMHRLAEIAAATGVVVSIKPHVSQAVYDTPSARRFMGEVDPRYVGLNVDASHLLRAGEEPAEAVRALAPHVATARIRDAVRDVDGPGTVEQQIPGRGQLDMAALAAAIAVLPVVALARRRIGGATGDVYGACTELGQLAALVVFAAG
jgi:sugar phosphate isomerase/epimerase